MGALRVLLKVSRVALDAFSSRKPRVGNKEASGREYSGSASYVLYVLSIFRRRVNILLCYSECITLSPDDRSMMPENFEMAISAMERKESSLTATGD